MSFISLVLIVLPTKKRACRIGKRVCLLVSWKGIEPPTYRLGGDRSILLSYQDVNVLLFSEPFYYNTNRESVQSQIFCHSRRHTPFHQDVRIEPKSCQANFKIIKVFQRIQCFSNKLPNRTAFLHILFNIAIIAMIVQGYSKFAHSFSSSKLLHTL